MHVQLRWSGLEGRRFPYRLSGAARGRPVLFLSGAFQDMHSWRRFERALAHERPFLVCDLPGSGAADPLEPDHGLDFLARAVEALLDDTGLGAVDVVASSYGAPVAQRFAMLFPERVRRLALVGVMSSLEGDARRKVELSLEHLRANDMPAFARLAVESLTCCDPARHIARRRLTQGVLRRSLRALAPDARDRFALNSRRLLEHDPLDLSRPLACPSLVFTGEHDTFTPPARCREVARALGDAQFTLVRDADHLVHLERFEVTVELLRGFFADRSLSETAGCQAWEHFRAPAAIVAH